jgi:rod shape-determining protein MreC
MVRSKKKKSQLGVILIIAFLGVFLFSLDIGGYLTPLRSGSDSLLNPVRYWFSKQSRTVSTLFRDLSSISSLKNENVELKSQVIDLESQVTELKSVESENDDLRLQLQIPNREEYDLVEANIIGGDLQSLSSTTLIVDKGSSDGVGTNDTVVYSKYLIGKIDDVSENSSIVNLTRNEDLEIPVISEDNRTKGIVKGDVNTGLVMSKILREENLNVNEKILTSGIGNYPKDLIVGYVFQIEGLDADVEKTAYLLNDLDLKVIDKLFIINVKKN